MHPESVAERKELEKQKKMLNSVTLGVTSSDVYSSSGHWILGTGREFYADKSMLAGVTNHIFCLRLKFQLLVKHFSDTYP